MRLLTEYLSTKVNTKKFIGFPTNFNLDNIVTFLTNNGFIEIEDTLSQTFKFTIFGKVSNYIFQNTPYSSINNKLDKIVYVNEIQTNNTENVYAFVMTYEDNKDKLICHFITYNAENYEIEITSFNSSVVFDARKMYRSYAIENNIHIDHKDAETFEEFKKEIDHTLNLI